MSEVIRSIEDIALCCAECACEDCIVSTYEKCKSEQMRINRIDDDLSNICIGHWKDWLIGKQGSTLDRITDFKEDMMKELNSKETSNFFDTASCISRGDILYEELHDMKYKPATM